MTRSGATARGGGSGAVDTPLHRPEIDLRTFAEQRRLRDATVQRMAALASPARQVVLEWAVALGLNDNQLRDALDAVDDIAARTGSDTAAILCDPQLAVAQRSGLGRSDRVREFKAALRRMRYPRLTAALARLGQLRDELDLPGGARIDFPVDLDGDEVVLIVRGNSAAQLRGRAAAVAAALDRPALEAIYAILAEGSE